jgi:Bacteriophage abortive infection AbiH
MGQRLFIIGNGFDLHHELKTSYRDFADFLKIENSSDSRDQIEIFDACNDLLGYECTNGSIWGNFEDSLGRFEPDRLFEKCLNYLDDDDPHRSGEASWEGEKLVDLIAKGMPDALKKWILGVQNSASIVVAKLLLPTEARYLTFNYTNILESFYGIVESQICHIHGTAEMLLIGHGVEPSEAEGSRPPTEPKPEGMSAEQEEDWEDWMSSQGSQSADWLHDEIDEYWWQSYKDTDWHLAMNAPFFEALAGTEDVTIMGHSLSEVDMPYFSEILRRCSPHANWQVSYFDDCEKEQKKKALISIGVDENRIALFKLEEWADLEFARHKSRCG